MAALIRTASPIASGNALQKAQDSVRLIYGTIVSSCPNGTYTLWTIVTPGGERYETAYWHDNALAGQLDQYGKDDTILCQVYWYDNPRYRCWKIWDLLEFNQASGQELALRLQAINASITRLQAGLEQLQGEASCCRDLQGVLVHTRQLHQQQANVRGLTGYALLGLGIALAPLTWGGSLSMLPGSVMLLTSGTDGAETLAEVQVRHRVMALTRRHSELQPQAQQTLDNAQAIETIVAAAKQQPWKRGSDDDYGIFTSPALRTVAALAQLSG